jgi:hypothetical protein
MITANFSLREMIHSDIAVAHNIRNVPNGEHLDNLIILCQKLLQPIRDALGIVIEVSSGFRCPALNAIAASYRLKNGRWVYRSGSKTSDHMKGRAADLKSPAMTARELFYAIIDTGIEFDQIILEFDRWVHISFRNDETNRRQVLIATRKNKRVIYSDITKL